MKMIDKRINERKATLQKQISPILNIYFEDEKGLEESCKDT